MKKDPTQKQISEAKQRILDYNKQVKIQASDQVVARERRAPSDSVGVLTAPTALPPECRPGGFSANRLAQCDGWYGTVVWTKVEDGVLVESGHITAWLYEFDVYEAKKKEFKSQVTLMPNGMVNDTEGSVFLATATCSSDCVILDSPANVSAPVAVGTNISRALLVQTAPLARWETRNNVKVTWRSSFAKPGHPETNVQVNGNIQPARCDQAMTNTSIGCVLSEYYPTMSYSSAEFPDLVRHINLSIANGMPSLLERVMDEDKATKNREFACKDSYVRPATKSCDEYPFASTRQGAYTGSPVRKGRTFSKCTIPQLPTGKVPDATYSACMIDETQNSLGGSRLNSFFLANRVIDGDVFEVHNN